MTVALADPPESLTGSTLPRIAPPEPIHHRGEEYAAAARCLGITLMPWQVIASHYMMATGTDGWLYREFADVVARRNGKTELLLPRLHDDLHRGRRAIHTAQNRTLPRQVFLRLAHHYEAKHAKELEGKIRYANGQEEMVLRNGGGYLIVAPQRGARGLGADTFIFDELREFEDDDILGAAAPTLASSSDPQRIYLSNAGTASSVILNDLKRRSEEGATGEFGLLAYLEWSAAPDRLTEDRAGWAEANPAMGRPEHPAGHRMLANLEDAFRTLSTETFETEHLCRWVSSMQPKLISDYIWQRAQSDLEAPLRPVMAVSMAPTGDRASAVLAWQQTDGTVALLLDADVTGDPIDVDRLGPELNERAIRAGVTEVLFDPWTDADLARYFRKSRAVTGREFANASENFVRIAESSRLRWAVSGQVDVIGLDLAWTARRPHESGAWMAVRAKDDRQIPAALAAIRAAWVASGPKPGNPRVL